MCSSITWVFYQFPNDFMMLHIFSYIYLSSVQLLWWRVCSALLPIFKSFFSCCWLLTVLCIFLLSLLSDVSLHIFSSIICDFSFSQYCLLQSWCLFVCLILIKFSLSSISFLDCTFHIISKKVIAIHKSPRYLLMLFYKSWIVLWSTFRSMIHFYLAQLLLFLLFFFYLDLRCSSLVF